ncbi:MAG TPA: FGGY family carbohydrate kinase, partial [Magnetospirillaceae bacterium]|nr:FGGY family carbohydrate kinase [Magnetospirillaceae bacterium]
MPGTEALPSILAVDIGTSSVRAVAFTTNGSIPARRQYSYGTIRPAPFFEEQDPHLVREAVYGAIRDLLSSGEIDPARIVGICFASQMYGVFPVDRDDRALANNILWSDGRAEAQAERWKRELGPLGFYPITGCPLNSIYPIVKLRWMREKNPGTFSRAVRFVSIKDFVTAPLTGQWACDYSMASSTGMLDIRKHAWHPEALYAAGVTADNLPAPVSGLERFSLMPDSPLAGSGLPAGLPVFLGGGDGPLANLGSGASGVGDVNIDLGTSGAARTLSASPVTDPDAALWCFCLTESLWAYGGIVTNAGNAYQWLGSGILQPAGVSEAVAYELLNVLAAGAGPGAGGLISVPYLRKARSPYWDGRLRGTLYGLTADHGIGHIARAFLEAVAFDLKTILTLMEERVRVA